MRRCGRAWATAARVYWASQATLDVMTRDYETALADARMLPAPVRRGTWPAHLGDGSATGRTLLRAMGVPWPL